MGVGTGVGLGPRNANEGLHLGTGPTTADGTQMRERVAEDASPLPLSHLRLLGPGQGCASSPGMERG